VFHDWALEQGIPGLSLSWSLPLVISPSRVTSCLHCRNLRRDIFSPPSVSFLSLCCSSCAAEFYFLALDALLWSLALCLMGLYAFAPGVPGGFLFQQRLRALTDAGTTSAIMVLLVLWMKIGGEVTQFLFARVLTARRARIHHGFKAKGSDV
jgi:hypothetical protein